MTLALHGRFSRDWNLSPHAKDLGQLGFSGATRRALKSTIPSGISQHTRDSDVISLGCGLASLEASPEGAELQPQLGSSAPGPAQASGWRSLFYSWPLRVPSRISGLALFCLAGCVVLLLYQLPP